MNAMGTRLFVGNLSYRVTEPELREVFEEGGRNVVEVKIVTDRDTGRSRGFAFVEMGSDDHAGQAIQTLNGREVSGRAINVGEARARAPRAGGWSGEAGGGAGGHSREPGREARESSGRASSNQAGNYEGRGRRGGW
jgi:cold-inducible RNA-binding protein